MGCEILIPVVLRLCGASKSYLMNRCLLKIESGTSSVWHHESSGGGFSDATPDLSLSHTGLSDVPCLKFLGTSDRPIYLGFLLFI